MVKRKSNKHTDKYSQSYHQTKKEKTGFSPATKSWISDLWQNPFSGKRILIALFWLYVVFRIVATDLDLFLFDSFYPGNKFDYVAIRLSIFLILFAALWIYLKTVRFWKNILEVVLFPIYPIGFYLFKWFVISMPLRLKKSVGSYSLYLYIETIATVVVRIRHLLLKLAMWVLMIIALIRFEKSGLWVAIIISSILLIQHFWSSVKRLKEPFRIFRINLEDMTYDKYLNLSSIKEVSSIDNNKKKKDKKLSNIQNIILYQYIARKIGVTTVQALKSKNYLIDFLLNVFYSLFVSIVLFGILNFGIYSIDVSNYSGSFSLRLFDFMEYSFNNLFFNSSQISPLSDVARLLKMGQGIYFWGLEIIILVLYISVRSSKYEDNLSKITTWSVDKQAELSDYLYTSYGKNPAESINWLKKKQSNIIEIMNAIDRFIK